MSPVNEAVRVWTTAAGQPERLLWRSRSFDVTDTPTVLVGACEWWSPLAPHANGSVQSPLFIAGWRFQATADNGETHVFDVHHDDDGGRWRLVRIFD